MSCENIQNCRRKYVAFSLKNNSASWCKIKPLPMWINTLK